MGSWGDIFIKKQQGRCSMTSAITSHPIVDTLLFSAAISKILRNDQWFSHKLADLKFAETLLQHGNISQAESVRLKRYIFKKNITLLGIRKLSQLSLFPIALFAGAFYLDNRWFVTKSFSIHQPSPSNIASDSSHHPQKMPDKI